MIADAYTDDSSFLFNNKKSVIGTFKILDMFSFFLGVRPDTEKCEVVGDWCKERGKGSALWDEKTLTLKKHRKFWKFIFLTTKNLKVKRIIYKKFKIILYSKIIYKK